MKIIIAMGICMAVSGSFLPSGRAETGRYVRQEAAPNEWIVRDTATGLVWQGCAAGTTGRRCELDQGEYLRWRDALGYCEALSFGGYTDWRLPNQRELLSIVDYTRFYPSIDESAFPDTPVRFYWSSTTDAGDPAFAWYVDFHEGFLLSAAKSELIAGRCVRDGAAMIKSLIVRHEVP